MDQEFNAVIDEVAVVYSSCCVASTPIDDDVVFAVLGCWNGCVKWYIFVDLG